MILYFAVAIAVFVYYSKSRNAPWWEMAVLALFWPLVFLVYLFNAATGRNVRSSFCKPRPQAVRPRKGERPEKMNFRNAIVVCFTCLLALGLALGGCGDHKEDQTVERDQHGFPTSVDGPVGELDREGRQVRHGGQRRRPTRSARRRPRTMPWAWPPGATSSNPA